MTPSARLQAAIELLDTIIVAVREGGAAADTLIARYWRDRRYAGSKDRRAVRDLVYRAIRRAAERPETGRAAMLGLAEEDAALAPLFDGSSHGPAPRAPDEPAAPAGVIPAWIAPLFAQPVGEDERAALLDRAPLDIRVNRLRASVDAVRTALPDARPIPGLPDGLRLPEGFPIDRHPLFLDGGVEVQDAGSQHIVAACHAAPGMTVIDLCAGAGGKTLGLAAAMANEGRLIACDTVRDRLARLTPRAERAGAAVEILLLDAGRERNALAAHEGQADLVLVDAPCSGSGTWRRNPEARWRLTPERLSRLVATQAHILDIAAPLVRPGGFMVYAVCSLIDAEGRRQIDAFLSRHPEWQADEAGNMAGRRWGGVHLLTPGVDGTDGFCVARLHKSC